VLFAASAASAPANGGIADDDEIFSPVDVILFFFFFSSHMVAPFFFFFFFVPTLIRPSSSLLPSSSFQATKRKTPLVLLPKPTRIPGHEMAIRLSRNVEVEDELVLRNIPNIRDDDPDRAEFINGMLKIGFGESCDATLALSLPFDRSCWHAHAHTVHHDCGVAWVHRGVSSRG
jgi:hypothetical protein